jgi:hypothetical protein
MRCRDYTWCALALALLSAAGAKPAPVPKGAKPPVACVLTLDAKANPLDAKAFTLTITNNTDKPIELLSTLPGGILVFLDIEIQNAAGKRVSPERYDATIASPYAPPPRPVATLSETRPEEIKLHALSRYFEMRDPIKPGKYRVRVKFAYLDYAATSEWVAFEVAKP